MTAPFPPTLAQINEGYEAEHQAGFEAGRLGEPWAMPLDESGLFALYPSPSPQMAAWSRGHLKGRMAFLAAQREQAATSSTDTDRLSA